MELRDEVGFFNRLAAEVRKITTPEVQASKEAEQAVRQFMSEGLAAGDVVDVFGLADKDRPEISVLSDEFLDSITKKTGQENIQRKLLQKLLDDQLKARRRTNNLQAKRFSEEIEAVLRRYEQRQLSSAEVVERLIEIAKRLRDSAHRHEELGLTEEEAAFYDALAGGVEHIRADPDLAALAHELVENIRKDLSVDWTDREATEAKIRTKIKRLLRRNRDKLPRLQPAADGHRHRWWRRGRRRRDQPLHAARARPGQGDVPLLAGSRRPVVRRRVAPSLIAPAHAQAAILGDQRRIPPRTAFPLLWVSPKPRGAPVSRGGIGRGTEVSNVRTSADSFGSQQQCTRCDATTTRRDRRGHANVDERQSAALLQRHDQLWLARLPCAPAML